LSHTDAKLTKNEPKSWQQSADIFGGTKWW